MSGFIEWLEDLNARDTKVRAVLRRSLAFDPGSFVPAYPYVEPFLKGEENQWRRQMLYLVASLWAVHWREGGKGSSLPIGKACAVHQAASGSTSTERRFINLLDADSDQLPHRLRQMIALLKEQAIDFESLLRGLLYWNDDQEKPRIVGLEIFTEAWLMENLTNIKFKRKSANEKDYRDPCLAKFCSIEFEP